MHTRPTTYLIIIVFFLLMGCQENRSSAADDIKQTMLAYRDAWKRGDQLGILDRVSHDIVLHMPTLSGRPVRGKEAVSAFWFPASDVSYPITAYEVSDEQITVNGDLAFYSGVSRLSWHILKGEVRSDSTTSVSEFLNVLQHENGQWKLLRIIYNLKDSTYSGRP